MENIIEFIKTEFLIILLAAAPISELRGAIPLAIGIGFNPIHSAILGIIGNSIPVPFLLLLLKPVFEYLGKTKAFGGFVHWITKRTIKRSEAVKKYSALGLFLLVAIPLPSTGAWTGCLAASLFKIDFRYAFPAILAGIITAAIIVTTLSYKVSTII